jgi:2-amino-4-hydroxy-6-hydroxymethyldihydropteridine diphosphokinase
MKTVISLGSNIGDRVANLNGAIEKLKGFIKIDKVSTFHDTDPVGGPEQPNFLNAVLIGDTNLDPHELLIKCLEVENEFGRTREIHWGPRTLDIDLISVGESVIKSETLTLPHPLAHERKFVLEPWLEVDPNGELIGRGRVSDLLQSK